MNLGEKPKQMKEGVVVSDLEPVTVLGSVNADSDRPAESADRVPWTSQEPWVSAVARLHGPANKKSGPVHTSRSRQPHARPYDEVQTDFQRI